MSIRNLTTKTTATFATITLVVLSLFAVTPHAIARSGASLHTSSEVTPEARNAALNTLKHSANGIWFEKNAGQFNNPDVLFGFRAPFGSVGVYKNKLRIVANQKELDEAAEKEDHAEVTPVQIVDITFPGSNQNWTMDPGSKSSVHGSYCTDKGIITPDIFNEVTVKNVYPGVDLRLYSGRGGAMEFDWLVGKAADYAKIKMSFNGQDNLKIADNGDLVIKLHENDMKIVIPETYQFVGGNKNLLKTKLEMTADSKTVGYNISGNINPNLPLVIDPVMIWSTYMNDGLGSGFDEYLYAIASNAAGEVFCAGQTNVAISVAYMSNVSAGYSNSFPGANNATYSVLYKLNAAGTAILAWTMTGAPAGSYSNPSVVPTSMGIFPNGRILLCYAATDLVQIFSTTLAARFYSGSVNPANAPSNASYNSVSIVDDSTFYISGSTTTAYPAIVAANAPDPTFAGSSEGIIMRVSLSAVNIPSATWGTYVGGNNAETFAAIALSKDHT